MNQFIDLRVKNGDLYFETQRTMLRFHSKATA